MTLALAYLLSGTKNGTIGKPAFTWDVVVLEDNCSAPYCGKCHLYGHAVARCPPQDIISRQCGAAGHSKEYYKA